MSILRTVMVVALSQAVFGCNSKFADSTTEGTGVEGTNPGDCSDGADNDADALFDCDDPGCAGSPFCGDDGGGGSGSDGSGSDGSGSDGSGSGSDGSGSGSGSGSDGSGSGTGGGDGGGGPIDDDGDGFHAIHDCDDDDAAVNPDATEYCDGIDNDCDGEIDVNAVDGTAYYDDQDGDGYGDPDYETYYCEPMHSHVTNDGDCDDDNELVFPGVAESCDGLDNDCNGEIDEGLETTMYFADSDGDGYGDPDASVEACLPPEDHVENAEDCDDERYIVNPEGTEISWSDVDEDCDGYDLDFLDCAEDASEDSLDYLEGFTYTVSDISGSVRDPFFGILTIGSYALSGGVLWVEADTISVTPTAEHDVFDLSITVNFYMNSNLWADYEGFDGATSCALSSGPLPVNYSGTYEINPRESPPRAEGSVNLETTLLADPSAVTSFSGSSCDIDLVDALFSLADIDFSPTSMVDDSLADVANAFEGIMEEDLELQTPITCSP